MADTKQSDFADLTEATIALGDKSPLVDISDTSMAATGTNKEITLQDLADFLAVTPSSGYSIPRIKRLNSQHSVTGVTGTKVTDLDIALEAGTFTFNYSVINRSATATTGVGLGINFSTGTAAVKVAMRRNVATITTASNGLTEEESGAALVTGGVMNAWATKAYSTTAPNMMAEGVGATGVDLLDIVEGVVIVTVTGTLELWHSSQIAVTTTTLEVGSSLVVIRTA